MTYPTFHPRTSLASRVSQLLIVGLVMAMLASCGGPAPLASRVTTSPAASPEATSSSFPSAGAPSSATGSDPDAGAAVDAFKAFVQTDRSFHLAGDMLMKVGKITLQAAIASDVSKGDEQGSVDLRGPGVSVRLAVVLIDGKVYLKVANRPWQTVAGRNGYSNPLGGLRVEGLVPVDIVNVGASRTHHLHVDNPESINGQTLSGNTLTDLTISSSSFDVYITNDGVPLTAIVEFAGTGTFGKERGPVTAKIRYDFSKFDQVVDVVAPIAASPAP